MEDFKLKRYDLQTMTRHNLMKYIKSMNLKVSNKLPREEELCQILGVSRITLRTTLDYLSSDGIIFRRQGKGTFVNPSSLELKVKFNPAKPFYHMIEQSKLTPNAMYIYGEIIPCNEEVASALDINIGDNVYVCKKLILADEKPCAFIVDYIKMTNFEDGYFVSVKESTP